MRMRFVRARYRILDGYPAARLDRSGSRSHQGASRKSITAWFSGAAHYSGSQWPQSGSTLPLTCVA